MGTRYKGYRLALGGLTAACLFVVVSAALALADPARFTGVESRKDQPASDARPLQLSPDDVARFQAQQPPAVPPGAIQPATDQNAAGKESPLGSPSRDSWLVRALAASAAAFAALMGTVGSVLEIGGLTAAVHRGTKQGNGASERNSDGRLAKIPPIARVSTCDPPMPVGVIRGPVILMPEHCGNDTPGPSGKEPPEIGISHGGPDLDHIPLTPDNNVPAPKDVPNNDVLGIIGLAKDIEAGRVYGPPDLSRSPGGGAWPGLDDILNDALGGNTTMFSDPVVLREQHRLTADQQRAKDREAAAQQQNDVTGDYVGPGQTEQPYDYVDPDVAEQQAKDEQARQQQAAQQRQDDINAPYNAPAQGQPYDNVDPDVAEQRAKEEQTQQQRGQEQKSDTRLHYNDSFYSERERSKNFNPGYTEHDGPVDKDMILVQIHASDKELGDGRSAKYWVGLDEALTAQSDEQYKEQTSLLGGWGKRDAVTIARIPQGELATYLDGTAHEQKDERTGERRGGGGQQYLFRDFDVNWIVGTRKVGEPWGNSDIRAAIKEILNPKANDDSAGGQERGDAPLTADPQSRGLVTE